MNNYKCPKCNASHYSVGISTSTLAYYQPIYKDGVNINPDRNIHTTNLQCIECGNNWQETN